jgi:hypothetical protein
MKKFAKVLIGICVILILLVTGAVMYTLHRMCKQDPELVKQEQEGVAVLINNLSSYLSVDETRRILEEEGYSSLSIIEMQKTSPADRRPRYDFTRIEIEDYRSLNQRGRLEVYFFNDQLMRVHYCPENIVLYLERRSKEAKSMGAYVEVRENPYCVWIADKRMEEKEKQWVKCYS